MSHRIVPICVCGALSARALADSSRPDPNEIPVPPIRTSMHAMPAVDRLPSRPEMPAVLTMNNGQPVRTPKQWNERRAEMQRILENYAVGQAPPPPGNVRGRVVLSQTILNGNARYRLVHLTFGPGGKLSLDIGIFTPAEGSPFPAVISPAGTPPGATPLARLPPGPTQGRGLDVLLVVRGGNPAPGRGQPGSGSIAESAGRMADGNPVLAHGFALVTFDHNDCGEDTTLREADGSWSFRTTRFYPAYPGYDWGLLRGWAWGCVAHRGLSRNRGFHR